VRESGAAIVGTEVEDTRPPDAVYVRQRWIPQHKIQWAKQCDRILLDYGGIVGKRTYPKQHLARYAARRLRELLINLEMHEPWQLKEHVNPGPDGWTWSLEYIPTLRETTWHPSRFPGAPRLVVVTTPCAHCLGQPRVGHGRSNQA
jgi:hypothetical protein